MMRQSLRKKHKSLSHKAKQENDKFAEFKAKLVTKMKTDPKTRHYSIFHNFDESMIMV